MSGRVRTGLLCVAAVLALALVLLWTAGRGWYGEVLHAGSSSGLVVPAEIVADREERSAAAARTLSVDEPKQILFGDLHVHSSFSLDAFQLAMPMSGGEGAHPVSDACDFARFCADLDFWSINDHANSITPRRWRETVEAIRQCDAVAGETDTPDLVSFLGWEWTQMGSTPDNHYGHKNVLLRDLDDAAIPTRPIAAAPPDDVPSPFDSGRGGTLALGLGAFLLDRGHDLAGFLTELADVPACPTGVPVRDLSSECREEAATPEGLFAKLRDWDVPSLVIPHGTTWGMYTPPGSKWDKQLTEENHDPERQRLIEVYSGHGNAESYRSWKAVEVASDGTRTCPEPTGQYLPACRRAGEIIRERCEEEGSDAAVCDAREAAARQNFVDADRNGGPWTVPGVLPEDWLDAGQCRNCFQPAFNYRPQSSVQSILALSRSGESEAPARFRFGFVASSDIHTARPGTGFKETSRRHLTDARMGEVGRSQITLAHRRPSRAESDGFELADRIPSVAFFETERSGSYFVTGGLAAVHADGRSREEIWSALERRETYGTSGPRILLWFDLVNPGDGTGSRPMGSEVEMQSVPRFRARAVGSFEQKPGCPEHTEAALTPSEIARLCRGECYHPSDERREIVWIEVVRIRPGSDEDLSVRIEDPWRVFACEAGLGGCEAEFEDPEFPVDRRDVAYYVRAIEAASPTIGADPLGCTRGQDGSCETLDPCFDRPDDDDCLSPSGHRAWSSPIFVDFQ